MFRGTLVVCWMLTMSAFAHDALEETYPTENCVKITKASDSEKSEILAGQQKYNSFIEQCREYGIEQKWCEQLTHPNRNSKAIFHCTYEKNTPHILIHPDESTWINAFRAAKLVQRLNSENLPVEEIYNWWRPEQYNKNVDGVPNLSLIHI